MVNGTKVAVTILMFTNLRVPRRFQQHRHSSAQNPTISLLLFRLSLWQLSGPSSTSSGSYRSGFVIISTSAHRRLMRDFKVCTASPPGNWEIGFVILDDLDPRCLPWSPVPLYLGPPLKESLNHPSCLWKWSLANEIQECWHFIRTSTLAGPDTVNLFLIWNV